MGNTLLEETPTLRRAMEHLRQLLPVTWDLDLLDVANSSSDRRYDADLVVRAPGGKTTFALEVKTSERGTQSARTAVAQLRNYALGRPALLVTRFANPALRKVCEDAGVSYLDETGWVYLRSDLTGLFVVHEGAKRAPVPDKREGTIDRLDGPGASAVIRSLWETRTPLGVRALAEKAGVSPGTAAKVLPSLARYGAIERDAKGVVTAVEHRLLLERWVQDYGFYTTNTEVHWCLASRGPDAAIKQLRNHFAHHQLPETAVALTGYLAAVAALPSGIYPVVPHSLLSLYAMDPELLASLLTLRPATRQTANVVIVRPRDASLVDPLRPMPIPQTLAELVSPYLRPVSVPQALADLMTMGGRFPELAEQVFDVVADNLYSPAK